MVENPNGPFQHNKNEEENDVEMEEEIINEEEDDDYPESEEFKAIDSQLDMINLALNSLEQKNDNILAELTSLLNENREIRKQLQECQTQTVNQENPRKCSNE